MWTLKSASGSMEDVSDRTYAQISCLTDPVPPYYVHC